MLQIKSHTIGFNSMSLEVVNEDWIGTRCHNDDTNPDGGVKIDVRQWRDGKVVPLVMPTPVPVSVSVPKKKSHLRVMK